MSGSPLPEQNIKALSCDGLVVWLKAHNVKPESCQIFEDNAVDGESFLDLSESDLKEMIPNKMGVVKRILKLQQECSARPYSPAHQPVASTKSDASYPPTVNGVAYNNLSSRHNSFGSSSGPPVSPRPKMVIRRTQSDAQHLVSPSNNNNHPVGSVHVPPTLALHTAPKPRKDTETEVDQTHPDSPMSPLAAYQSACQPQSTPPVRPRAKDGDSLKRRSANIQNLIQSIGLSADQISLQPHKSKGSLKRVKSCAVTTASEAEVSKLSAENFMEWLMMMGYSIQDCQAFRDNKVDGATFFLLETDELKEIVKSVETIKQLQELQKQLLGTTRSLMYLKGLKK